MTLFRSAWLSTLLLCLTVVGCVKADKDANPQEKNLETYSETKSLIPFNNRALFEMGDIEVENMVFSWNGKTDLAQVNQIQMYLRVCQIRDRGTQGTIRNQKFHLSSELGDKIYEGADQSSGVANPITVNGGNCLRWSQYIYPFDYLAKSKNIVLHYQVQSLGGGMGKVVKRIGCNFWDIYRKKVKDKPCLDLTDYDEKVWPISGSGGWVHGQKNIIAALKGELEPSDAYLWFRNLTVEAVPREMQAVAKYNEILNTLSPEERKIRESIDQTFLNQNGQSFSMNLQGQPFIRLKDVTDVPSDEEMLVGRFRVYMNIIASGVTDDSRKYLLSSKMAEISGHSTAFTFETTPNGLLASVPFLWQNRSELGRVEMVVKVVPVSSGHRNVRPFTGVLDLGQYHSWTRRQSAPFKFNEEFQPMTNVKYNEYVGAVSGITDDITSIRPQERFFFGPLVMRFVRIMPGETATDRTLQYAVKSCVEDGNDGVSVGRGLQFDIETEDQGRVTKIRRQTNQDGCLTWFGYLSHKYYRKEVLEKKVAKVRYVGNVKGKSQYDSMRNKFNREHVYYMNPWDEKFTFGWDEPDMPENYPQDLIEQRETAPVSQLFIPDYQYVTMGFRYDVDRYLNLKVKKTVLLKIYPYVLKYNSIVAGRLGTEKLRDGIYLMKVALQKDYLDPAARGVLIYDDKLQKAYKIADEKKEDTEYEAFLEDFVNPNKTFEGDGSTSQPVMAWSRYGGDETGEPVDREMFDSTLVESKKEFISVQTKLVQVIGGMIITPVEFEMDDLRLMRIRNQFFIQLQTIDENKLRIATMIDQTLNQMNNDGQLEAQYNDIFKTLDYLEYEADPQILKETENYERQRLNQVAAESFKAQGVTAEDAKKQLETLFGLDQFAVGSPEYIKRKAEIDERIARLDQYRGISNGYQGLPAQSAFRNDKRMLIDRLVTQFHKENQGLEKKVAQQLESMNPNNSADNLISKFFFMDTSKTGPQAIQGIIDYRIQKAREEGNTSRVVDLESLKISDFSTTPLTPSFSFELLRNDGEHDYKKVISDGIDDGKSGLPSRTFVGPLTFIFNTNGSPLRPTNTLNEDVCTTATCAVPQLLEDPAKGTGGRGEPPGPVDLAGPTDKDGNFLNLTSEPIYDAGDSVNAFYENSEFYGYLKAYRDITVDELIAKKALIDERFTRKMEEGSQIFNFTKHFKLKFMLLTDHDSSRLKSIDHDCAQREPVDQLKKCFKDVPPGNDILSKDLFFAQLNDRKTDTPIDYTKNLGLPPPFNFRRKTYDQKGPRVTEADINNLIQYGWADTTKVPLEMSKNIMHRLCFVLTENMFPKAFFEKQVGRRNNKQGLGEEAALLMRGSLTMEALENLCNHYVENLYDSGSYFNRENGEGTPSQKVYPPIVIERKVRAYRTNNRYVYRGGKSLNINAGANFTLSSSMGIKSTTTSNFKPWDTVVGGITDLVGKIPFLGTALGVVNVTRSTAKDEAAGETNGTTIYGGTFLVSQQATIDMALSEYERCMIAKFHPKVLRDFIDQIDDAAVEAGYGYEKQFNDNFIEKVGIMICTGQRETAPSKCLPIKEKYYYLTQHFTEGDMLDTADLHNHPWLLQLRGLRDFQIFTAAVGARQVEYIHDASYASEVVGRTMNDISAIRSGFTGPLDGSNSENRAPKFQMVSQDSDINWALNELSKAYFEISPTFPGLYTFLNETGVNEKEWPYEDTNPGQVANLCQE